MNNIYKSVVGLILTVFFTQINAADLTVICDIKETAKNQTQSVYKRRFEIDFEPRFYKAWIDTGTGFRKSEEGFPKDVNATRVVFFEDATISGYYDRKSSLYFYKNVVSGVEATGSCSQEKGGN